jgi:hypothetical protein
MKPLLDGMISAFHQHDSSNIDEVVLRLKKYINLLTQQIENLLLDSENAILGIRNLIQPYRNGTQKTILFNLLKLILIRTSRLIIGSLMGRFFR